MGEVYRARDVRLGRFVAVKVLPARFTADESRLQRFEQEARAVGMVNHPNILALYDIGTHDGTPYVVSELLEGQTLVDAPSASILGRAFSASVVGAHGRATFGLGRPERARRQIKFRDPRPLECSSRVAPMAPLPSARLLNVNPSRLGS